MASEQILGKEVEAVIPDSAMLWTVKGVGFIDSVNESRNLPNSGTSFTPGSKIVIDFPTEYMMDMSQSYLQFNVQYDVGPNCTDITLSSTHTTINVTVPGGGGEVVVDAGKRHIKNVNVSGATAVVKKVYKDRFFSNANGYTDGVLLYIGDDTVTSVTLGFQYDDVDYFAIIQNGISSLFDTIRITQGTTEIERLDNYNLVSRWLFEGLYSQQWTEFEGFSTGFFHNKLTGLSTNVNVYRGGSLSNSINITYRLPLLASGFWNLRYVPFFLMQTVTMELYTTSVDNAFITKENSGLSVTNIRPLINDFSMHCYLLSPKPWYMQQLTSEQANDNLHLDFITYVHHDKSVQGSNVNITMTDKLESIAYVMFGFRTANDLNSRLVDNGIARSVISYPTSAGGNGSTIALQELQYRFGQLTFPTEPWKHINSISLTSASEGEVAGTFIDYDTQLWNHVNESKKIFKMGSRYQGFHSYIDKERFFGFETSWNGSPTWYDDRSVLKEPQHCVIFSNFQTSSDNNVMSGLNTQAPNIDLYIKLKFTGAIGDSALVQSDIFLFHNKIVTIRSSGDTIAYK